MLAISPAPIYIYNLNQKNSNANRNVGNLDHAIVELNISSNVNGTAGIACWIYIIPI